MNEKIIAVIEYMKDNFGAISFFVCFFIFCVLLIGGVLLINYLVTLGV